MTTLAAARTLVFDERFRFDTFVVGDGTREAAEAARLVAESPGARWNPLIVRAGAGQGKSHLLGAVASRARELHPGRRMLALSADEYPMPPLGDAAIVLVDDVRAGLEPTRAAALRDLVDAALAAGAQVVIAEAGTAVSREEATAWVARSARARLVRLTAPDAEVRLAIVRQAAAARSLTLAPDVLASVADEPVDSVRELLGRLGRAGTAPATERFSLGDDGDFASFLDEVAREVAAYAEPWRVRLGEASARWRAEGHDVEVLERALRESAAPDVDALLAEFERGIARQQEERAAAEREAAARDAARVAARVAAEQAARRATPAPTTPPVVNAEGWVLDWPDVRDLLVEAYR
ncbi:Chromosomal replication initiator DnaA [Gemmatirosa kalamazoonensis]|uniref:Chromosomal replication initiator DnaA n=1 Tax=Gemmatirosa kalamazoonensis TaxID=861299 RepID=W0RJJ1_9BACT|nr:DnaA/Hda family protein [Gemmatirosa kalamazoonensis]AHG90597.1 Chromosomal replication initiator DnaA [Gemmatirosa kalamazoonensis]